MVKEVPDAVIADGNPALLQFSQQFAPGEVRLFGQPGAYPVRLIGQ